MYTGYLCSLYNVFLRVFNLSATTYVLMWKHRKSSPNAKYLHRQKTDELVPAIHNTLSDMSQSIIPAWWLLTYNFGDDIYIFSYYPS